MYDFVFCCFFFFFNDTATTEIYTLSLHDALPICRGDPAAGQTPAPARGGRRSGDRRAGRHAAGLEPGRAVPGDRKSTRLNSSHLVISYAVFCLKKKKKHVVPRQLRSELLS